MSPIADTVRFCFPAPSPPSSPGLPLHNRPSNRAPTSDGSAPNASASSKPARHGLIPHMEPLDLSKGVAEMSLRTALRHYAPDWILAALLWGSYAMLLQSPGHKREFSLTDISIQHSFAEHERVPPNLLAFISAGIPLLVLVPISTLIARNKWDVHNSVIGLFMSYTVTGVVTQLIKMSVGRPRPDLIARCIPVAGAHDHAVFGLSTEAICTTTNLALLHDGFKSFPSGHSSLSFAGLGFLSCYLAGKMHLWDKHGHRTRAWWALAPLLGGAMVAISRTEDNRHHWQDVLVGSLLGMFIAWVAYRTYFPPLHHPQCHLPLAPRAPESVDDAENDDDRSHRVRLLGPEGNGAEPRASEEEIAWRNAA